MFFDFIIRNKEFISIIIAFITVITPFALFLLSKRKEQNQVNFERFHKNLMSGLSNQDGKVGLDEQVAIIFELRNYSEYFPVIKRLLHYQINRWSKSIKQYPDYKILIVEAKETINYMNNNWLRRRLQHKK